METTFTKDTLVEELRQLYREEESRPKSDCVSLDYWWAQRRKKLDALELAITAAMEGKIIP